MTLSMNVKDGQKMKLNIRKNNMKEFTIEVKLQEGEISDFEQAFLEGTEDFNFSYEIIKDQLYYKRYLE